MMETKSSLQAVVRKICGLLADLPAVDQVRVLEAARDILGHASATEVAVVVAVQSTVMQVPTVEMPAPPAWGSFVSAPTESPEPPWVPVDLESSEASAPVRLPMVRIEMRCGRPEVVGRQSVFAAIPRRPAVAQARQLPAPYTPAPVRPGGYVRSRRR